MPRASLRRAQSVTRQYCEERDILYTETSLLGSYVAALRHPERSWANRCDGSRRARARCASRDRHKPFPSRPELTCLELT